MSKMKICYKDIIKIKLIMCSPRKKEHMLHPSTQKPLFPLRIKTTYTVRCICSFQNWFRDIRKLLKQAWLSMKLVHRKCVYWHRPWFIIYLVTQEDLQLIPQPCMPHSVTLLSKHNNQSCLTTGDTQASENKLLSHGYKYILQWTVFPWSSNNLKRKWAQWASKILHRVRES